eukprot:521843-Amphidinium_carterae.1
MKRAALGERHPAVATSLFNVGEVYSRQGRFAEALPHLEGSLAICKADLGAQHPFTVRVRAWVQGTREEIRG